MGDKRLLVIGTMGEEIISAELDVGAGSLSALAGSVIGKSPDWVEQHPTHRDLVYSVTRPPGGGEITLSRVSSDGSFTTIGVAKTGLDDPCHVQFAPDLSGLYIAHFLGGGVSYLPIDSDGRFVADQPAHIWKAPYTKQSHKRQWAAHCHQASPTIHLTARCTDGQIIIHDEEIIVPDQGCNKVFRLTYSPSTGFHLADMLEDFIEGEGPRHGVVHPNGRLLYIIGEMSHHVTLHTLPPLGSDERSRCIQRVPIFPPSDAKYLSTVPMLAAGLVLQGNRLICANRNSPHRERDALAVLELEEDGTMGSPLFLWPGMSHMRALSVSPDGKYVCVGGRDAGGVVVYDAKWFVVARLNLEQSAVPVWM